MCAMSMCVESMRLFDDFVFSILLQLNSRISMRYDKMMNTFHSQSFNPSATNTRNAIWLNV